MYLASKSFGKTVRLLHLVYDAHRCIVKVAFVDALSERQLYTLLAYVRQYATCRASREDEHHALVHAGYPDTYDLCAHIDTLPHLSPS